MDIKELVGKIEEELKEIRRDFHTYPELSNQEFRTADRICQYLESWGESSMKKGLQEQGL